MRYHRNKMMDMNSNTFIKYTVGLLLFISSHVAYAQTFYHCPDILRGAKGNIYYIDNRILYMGWDTLVVGNQFEFDCSSNTVVGLPNIRLIDFYPINDYEFLMIDDYDNLIIYDIIAKEIKRVVMTQREGMYEIRRYKSSTYISSYYGIDFVNHDNLATDIWEEKTVPLPFYGYIHEMKFITDDFFVFGLGIEDTRKGGIAITHDGGATWKVDTTGFEYRISCIEYLGDNHLVVIDNGGNAYYSDDMGMTWVKKKIHPDFEHAIGSEVVGTDIYVVGGYLDDNGYDETAYLFKSTDYGRTWQQIFKSENNRLGLFITKDEQNRLYFTTADGSVFYTKESVSSAHDVVLHDISIQPNPVATSFRIGTTGTDRYTVQIRDLTGAVIMALSDIYPGSDIDISSLPAGIYIVHGNTGDGRSFVQKLVKVE